MTAALLFDLSAAGVKVRMDEQGTLKASGDQAALDRWLPEIRTHKAEILALLAANDPEPVINYRLFVITRPTSEAFTVSRNPPCTLAEIQGDYPGCTVALEPALPPAAALEGESLAIAYAVLRAWGEDDTESCMEWLDSLARDPVLLEQMEEQAVALGVARWEDAPTPAPTAPAEIPRQMAVCARCAHWTPDRINPQGGLGHCRIEATASRRAGSLWPWQDAEVACLEFQMESAAKGLLTG